MTFEPDPLLLAVVALALLAVGWLHRRALRSPSLWLRAVTLLLLAGVALHPRLGGDDSSPPPSGADVVVLVDRTTSMAAQDYNGDRPRMAGVAEDVEALVASLPAARYTVVTSDNDAQIAAPWTTDTSAIITLAKTMGWREEGYGTGSDISAGVPLAQQLLRDSAAQRPEARRYLVYMGDGEQISEQEPRSFEPLRELVDDTLVLGYGTTEGGVMAMRPDTTELVTRDGVAQRSMLDEARLNAIASQLGGTYQHRESPGGLDGWAPLEGQASASDGYEPGVPVGWLLALAAALTLAVDAACTVRRARLARWEVR